MFDVEICENLKYKKVRLTFSHASFLPTLSLFNTIHLVQAFIMKYSLSIAAFAAFAVAAPTETLQDREPTRLNARAACASAVTLTPGSNPFSGRTLHANSFYASEVAAAVTALTDSSLASSAAAVGKVGSFLWL